MGLTGSPKYCIGKNTPILHSQMPNKTDISSLVEYILKDLFGKSGLTIDANQTLNCQLSQY